MRKSTLRCDAYACAAGGIRNAHARADLERKCCARATLFGTTQYLRRGKDALCGNAKRFADGYILSHRLYLACIGSICTRPPRWTLSHPEDIVTHNVRNSFLLGGDTRLRTKIMCSAATGRKPKDDVLAAF